MTCDEVRELAAGYVLGALTADEETGVRAHLAAHPDGHPEFAELGGVVPYLPESVEPMEPPAGLRSRLLAAAAADLEARGMPPATPSEPATPSQPANASQPATPSNVLAWRPARRRRLAAWAAGVAAVLVVGALGTSNLALRRELDTAQAYQRGLDSVMDLAAAPGSATAVLAPQGGSGASGIGAVGPDGTVAVVLRGLTPPAGSEVYEVWVIGADATPVAIGSVTMAPGGAATLVASRVQAAPNVTLAITREPAPGSTAPLGPVVAIGAATPGT